MVNKDFEIFANESKAGNDATLEAVKELTTLMQLKLPQQINTPDNITVKGEVEITNPTTDIEVTNLELIKEWLENLSESIDKSIKANKQEPVKEVTVKNIENAKPDTVKISNLVELANIIQPLIKLLRDTPPPIVNVDVPPIIFPTDAKKPISVRLSDGKTFYTAITQAIASSGGAVDDPLAGYQITDSDETTASKYYGYVKKGGAFYIMRELNGAYRYTKGGSGYTQYWTDRATDTYGYYHEVF